VTHVHQVDIDKQDRRYVLAYDVPEAGATGSPELRWYSADEETDKVYVAPGEYDRPMWFFPSRGAYEFQVYIRGKPNLTLSDAASVTSDYREYIVHVGAEANVSVGMQVTPQNPSPGNNVSIEITASNSGPDTAPSTKVDVTLPEGLTYLSHSPSAFTFADGDGDGVWTWDAEDLASSASERLAITATVGAETHGQDLTVKATISATETVTTNSGTYEVPVPDPGPQNTATGTVTVASSANVEPMFSIARSVPENTPHGHPVGAPIPVLPGDSDPLNYTLTGSDAGSFTVERVASGAQIRVHGSADLDFETKASYLVVLNVSDGKDASGNADPAIDSSIAVPISITDVAETVRVTATCEKVGERGTCTATVSNLPSADTVITYSWTVFDLPTNSWSYVGHNSNTYTVYYNTPGTRKFQVHVTYTDANGKKHYIHSGFPALTWP